MSDKKCVPNEDEQRIIDKVVEIVTGRLLRKGKGKNFPEKRRFDENVIEVKEVATSLKAEQFILAAKKRIHDGIRKRIVKVGQGQNFKTSLDHSGFIDVLLERDDIIIACHVFGTDEAQTRVEDVLKAVSGGYRNIVCVPDQKGIEVVRQVLTTRLSESDIHNVMAVEFNGFVDYLSSISADALSFEENIKGRRIKVEFTVLPAERAQEKSDCIKRILGRHLRTQ